MVSLSRLPGIDAENSRARNGVVGVVYALGVLIALSFLPAILAFVILLSPILAGIAVGRNWRGSAEQLSGLPGIDPAGGVVSGVVAGIILLVVVSVVMAALPSSDTDDDTSEASATPTPTAEETQMATETTTPTQQQTEIPTETETETETTLPPPTTEEDLSDEDRIQLMRTVMESYDISVTDIHREDDTIQVSYTSTASTRSEITTEMGYVSGSYVGAVDEGETAERMEVTIYNTAGEVAGTYHIEREWAEERNNEDISSTELSARILETLEATG